MKTNRRFTLVRRPKGLPTDADFAIDTVPIPTPSAGQVVIENIYASLDPAIRGWLDDKPSYLPPIQLGDPIRATTIGRIAATENPDFAVGDWVVSLSGIETYSLVNPGGFLMKIDTAATPHITNHLSVLGAIGFTAYFGLLEIGRPQPGNTVLVTGAAGAVGSLVGQIARIKGCRTIGIAGGSDKCLRLTQDYGYDAAVDYRGLSTAELAAAIAQAAPNGIDVIFENVGGAILDAGLRNLNKFGRVALCGLISEYNTETAIGARDIWQLIVKSATITGFLVPDFIPKFGEAVPIIAGWLNEGKLRVDEHIDHGLDNALPAFLRLFNGTNQGKMILQIGNP